MVFSIINQEWTINVIKALFDFTDRDIMFVPELIECFRRDLEVFHWKRIVYTELSTCSVVPLKF
mgnify:CR=1 FL=1